MCSQCAIIYIVIFDLFSQHAGIYVYICTRYICKALAACWLLFVARKLSILDVWLTISRTPLSTFQYMHYTCTATQTPHLITIYSHFGIELRLPRNPEIFHTPRLRNPWFGGLVLWFKEFYQYSCMNTKIRKKKQLGTRHNNRINHQPKIGDFASGRPKDSQINRIPCLDTMRK